MIYAFLLGLVACPPVTQESRTDRLAAYIVQTSPSARPYARLLAERILWEAEHYQLDPGYLAAICWTESRFRVETIGSSGEMGAWQIMPEYMFGPTWGWLRYKVRYYWATDIVYSTWLAATLVATHLARCRWRHASVCYAAYNSGSSRRVRAGYRWRLVTKSRHIRGLLGPTSL